jgi:hypothetical protein
MDHTDAAWIATAIQHDLAPISPADRLAAARWYRDELSQTLAGTEQLGGRAAHLARHSGDPQLRTEARHLAADMAESADQALSGFHRIAAVFPELAAEWEQLADRALALRAKLISAAGGD